MRSISKRHLVYALAGLALLVGLGAALMTRGGAAPPEASPPARAALERCAGRDGEGRTRCYLEHVERRVREAGTRSALEMLAELAEREPRIEADGHRFVHAVGMAAYRATGDVHRAFEACTDIFQSGCRHGTLQAHFMALDSVADEDVREACRPYRRRGRGLLAFQCHHGLGHGLTLYYGHHLPLALDSCDALEGEEARHSCYGGAFMENAVHATRPHRHAAAEATRGRGIGDPDPSGAGGAGGGGSGTDGAASDGTGAGGKGTDGAGTDGPEAGGAGAGRTGAGRTGAGRAGAASEWMAMDPDDPHHPCSIVAERYLTACYEMQTSIMIHLNDGSLKATVENCEDAPEGWRDVCFRSLGRSISIRAYDDLDRAVRLCRAGEEGLRPHCFQGLAHTLMILGTRPFPEVGFDLCRRVSADEPDERLRCWFAVGRALEPRLDAEERRGWCERAPRPRDRRACRIGAALEGGSIEALAGR